MTADTVEALPTYEARLMARFFPKQIHVWKPYPKQQQAAELAAQCFELLYGGAAGGGKSMFLRGYAVEYALQHPGSHIGIVRRTLPMLKQTHGLHLTTLCGEYAKENKSEFTWTFTNTSVIRFISLPNAGDEQQYKSAEFDVLLFDEVTELLETQYTYMLSRCRSARGYRAHAIATANPEGRGFRWVKRRWVTPKEGDLAPGQPMPVACKPWAPPEIIDGKMLDTWQPLRCFLPATVMDNPGLLENNPAYVQILRAMPDGRMRRALLDGDWTAMDQIPGALWNQTTIDEYRVNQAPELIRIVIGVDPSGTSHSGSDECGIIAAGLGNDGRYYVLRDISGVVSPEVWAARVVLIFDDLGADRVVAETNFGADMVISVLHNACPTLPTKKITASRGKAVRAEPIAYLYTDGKVSHVGQLMELEDEQCGWIPGSNWSPGRLDALVWALTELTGGGALQFLRALSVMCPDCGLPNVPHSLQCFQCQAVLPQLEEATE